MKKLLLLFLISISILSCRKDEIQNAPLLDSSIVVNMTSNSITISSSIIDNGGSDIIAKGICYNITENPTINNNKTIDGTNIGTFTSSINNLIPGATYYIKSYAINSIGISYSNQLIVKTNSILAIITTSEASNITTESLICGGNISYDGGSQITAKGTCYGTSKNPTINDNKTFDGVGSGTFISNISNLSPSTTYYLRAYSINNAGVSYGNEIIIKTQDIKIVGWVSNNNIIAYRTDANYSKLDFKTNDIWSGESINGIDNDLSTQLQNCWWVGTNADVWYLPASFYYDLKNNTTLNSFKFYGESGFPYSSVDNFQLYCSDSPLSNWTLVLDVKMPSSYINWQTFNFTQKTARYWKLTVKPTNKAFGIKEIAFGNF